jgi:hypothetical protein
VSVTIDFVAIDAGNDACLLVLVEPGPWIDATIGARLTALQDRLYGCLEAALDGKVAERYPEAVDKKFIVRVDCYNCHGIARDEVDAFIKRFSTALRDMPDYSPSSSQWVRAFEIEVNHDQIH